VLLAIVINTCSRHSATCDY